MAKYRSKPFEVEAFFYDGSKTSQEKLVDWAADLGLQQKVRYGMLEDIYVKTATGLNELPPNSFAIAVTTPGREEIYPCPEDLFKQKYEVIE